MKAAAAFGPERDASKPRARGQHELAELRPSYGLNGHSIHVRKERLKERLIELRASDAANNERSSHSIRKDDSSIKPRARWQHELAELRASNGHSIHEPLTATPSKFDIRASEKQRQANDVKLAHLMSGNQPRPPPGPPPVHQSAPAFGDRRGVNPVAAPGLAFKSSIDPGPAPVARDPLLHYFNL